MKRTTIGIVAHVDAGKTTCIESMLFDAGVIRKLGRVDHQDTVLDYDEQERGHGITIYSKEAHYTWKNTEVYVIDTPGHVDFSSEMERSLQVLDLAVIMINGQDGVQSHTETIWKCLEHYGVPCILFVNKMDISHFDKNELMNNLKQHCSDMCINLQDESIEDTLAMISDEILEDYSNTGSIDESLLKKEFYDRKWFPVLFGSALKNDGVEQLMNVIDWITLKKEYPEELGGRIYKISLDDKGNRLTHVKITGGVLKVKDMINEEKVDQIRLYNGTSFEMLKEVEAGMVVSLKGIEHLESGQGIGFEEDQNAPVLSAFMNYELVLPVGANALVLADTCKELASEDPTLQINVDEKTKKIHVQIMGEMQMEVLQKKIEDRSGIKVGFSTGRIVYQETIRNVVEGAGHFEPLRHYAEVHVRLEPLQQGSGIQVVSECSTDVLSSSWQRSILSALSQKRHRGVLTGSLLTDVKIVLVSGKGHIKHTVGGDFRQASNRAVRQALMKAENVLLEPYYSFELQLPSEFLSKALYDLEMKNATVEIEDMGDNKMCIRGEGPVRTMMNYQNEVIAYTKGKGRFFVSLKGYQQSNAQDEIIESIGYDPDSDMRNPSDSVFCANGSGYSVPWDKSDEYMHIQLKEVSSASSYQNVRYKVSDADMNYIASMTSSKNRNEEKEKAKQRAQQKEKEERERIKELRKVQAAKQLEELLIVDGYNMIYAWDSLKELAYEDLSLARDKLIEYLFNYYPYLDHDIWIVFDGYKVKGNTGTRIQKKGLTIIYTRADETADAFLEKSAYDLKDKYRVTYATSDALIQNAVFSQGAFRMSAKELESRLILKHVIMG